MAPITAMPTTTARNAPTVSRTTLMVLLARHVHCAPELWNAADAALKRPV